MSTCWSRSSSSSGRNPGDVVLQQILRLKKKRCPEITDPNDDAAEPNSASNLSQTVANARIGPDPTPANIRAELISGGNTEKFILPLSRSVEGCVQCRVLAGVRNFRSGRSRSRSSRFTLQFRRPAHPACRAAAAGSASPLSAEILGAGAQVSVDKRGVAAASMWHRPRSPSNQVRHCRRGTNPGHSVERGRWPR